LPGESVLVNEEVNFGHKGPGGWAEDECLLGKPEPRVEGVVCYSRKFC